MVVFCKELEAYLSVSHRYLQVEVTISQDLQACVSMYGGPVCHGDSRVSRSHVLLHCPNEWLRTAREEAWGRKDSGGVQVLLANPRWERRFLRFLELLGVGTRRVGADGSDEGSARAVAMDEWIVWEVKEKVSPGASS